MCLCGPTELRNKVFHVPGAHLLDFQTNIRGISDGQLALFASAARPTTVRNGSKVLRRSVGVVMAQGPLSIREQGPLIRHLRKVAELELQNSYRKASPEARKTSSVIERVAEVGACDQMAD